MRKWGLDLSKWIFSAEPSGAASLTIEKSQTRLYAKNTGTTAMMLTYKEDILIENKLDKCLKISFIGNNLHYGGACFYINDYPVTLNGTSSMEISPPCRMHLSLKIPANSEAEITEITLETREEELDLVDSCSAENDVLVITPDYPSTDNLYLCAFAHSRNIEYVRAGLHIQVASISVNNWYQTTYEMDGVPVLMGRYIDLKKLLSRHQYKVIVAHFVDENLYPIFDGYVQDERLIFICHGPETTFRFLTNRCRPYFTKELPEIDTNACFDQKEMYVKKYARKENVDWVFVSDWLRDFSEKMIGVSFPHSRVINNTINEELFPYHPKSPEDRKKILILRKFDNIRVHSIDISVEAILELSRRDFFSDLTFEVYGDGNYYDVLVEPLRQFPNVHLHRTFVPNNQVHELHAQNGIFLCPSRHDTQGVSLGEAAASGMVVVGSDVTCVGSFMNNEVNHTLADPEDPAALADIIERLYRNPDEFQAISERMSMETLTRSSRENTVEREIALIREKIEAFDNTPYAPDVCPSGDPILTIVVPAYNVETYLEKCFRSLVAHRNAGKTEIIVVNDGSKDHTAEIGQRFADITHGVVRVINKENGGHGSTINAGLAAATGKYFRLIDGDDWVDGENLAVLVDKLESETADVVLTKGSYEYVEKAQLSNIIDYDMLREGMLYNFVDLLYPGYGFQGYGPILISGNYRTEILQKANFHISEKCPYVDMEFNSFALRYVDTLRYYDLDIYRYLIGRAGQTVSRDFWKKKYMDHRYVILNILKTINEMPDYSNAKKKYVYEHITAPMIDSQVFMYDQLCLWEEIDGFLKDLNAWPEALEAGLNYIEKKGGDCSVIMRHYHGKIAENAQVRRPIIGGSLPASQPNPKRGLMWYLKAVVKACLPYGIMKFIIKSRYPGASFPG